MVCAHIQEVDVVKQLGFDMCVFCNRPFRVARQANSQEQLLEAQESEKEIESSVQAVCEQKKQKERRVRCAVVVCRAADLDVLAVAESKEVGAREVDIGGAVGADGSTSRTAHDTKTEEVEGNNKKNHDEQQSAEKRHRSAQRQ